MNRTHRKLLTAAAALTPWAVGSAGYYEAGLSFSNSLYAAFALYFTNQISAEYNGLNELARWTAPMVTASAVLCLLQHIWKRIRWRFMGFGRDSIAVYMDEDRKIQFEDGVRAAYPGGIFLGYFKSYIILFSSDEKSLEFYEEHRERLARRAVYIGLRELEQGLVKNMPGVVLFDINRAVARLLWKQIALWKQKESSAAIVVWGNGALAMQILETGLQLNLFDEGQSLHYDLVTDDPSYQLRHGDMDLMNGDEVLCLPMGSEQAWEAVRSEDIVIIADRVGYSMLQNIAVNARGRVYYYSPMGADAGTVMDFPALFPFGRDRDVFTDENIRNGKLIARAREQHEAYERRQQREAAERGESYTPTSWDQLSGFLQESNISSSDYGEILEQLLMEGMPEEELAELEHIRWCRFHYLQYWKYAAQRDNSRRLHSDLRPYEELSRQEKAKDLAIIRELREHTGSTGRDLQEKG